MRRIVVLPEPEGPISASFSPGMTSKDSPSSTFSVPKDLSNWLMRMIGVVTPVSPVLVGATIGMT